MLYTKEALALLIRVAGVDRCLFGAECPGIGSQIHPNTGKPLDDIAPAIRELDWLSADEKTQIFEGNARKLFKLDDRLPAAG